MRRGNTSQIFIKSKFLFIVFNKLVDQINDKIGEWSGAGSIVPITGFANSIVSPAMEFKREGFITGTAAKLFTIAGPVLVYGVGSSVIVGLLSLLFK